MDEQSELSSSEGINAIPTFKLYCSGKLLEELVGADTHGLEELIKEHLHCH